MMQDNIAHYSQELPDSTHLPDIAPKEQILEDWDDQNPQNEDKAPVEDLEDAHDELREGVDLDFQLEEAYEVDECPEECGDEAAAYDGCDECRDVLFPVGEVWAEGEFPSEVVDEAVVDEGDDCVDQGQGGEDDQGVVGEGPREEGDD